MYIYKYEVLCDIWSTIKIYNNTSPSIPCSTQMNEDLIYLLIMIGPDHWADEYEQCAGKHQSPINIDSAHILFEST